MKQLLRILLYPFSLLYGAVMAVRNLFFYWGIFKQEHFDVPIISIGNITVGGTGKTPHTEYVLRLFGESRRLAVLSRGYGRSTKGFRELSFDSTPEQCGDEPCQIKQKFPEVTVVVCEDRREGVRQIMALGDYDAIILDDAFQHRWVKPSFSVLLVDYARPIFKDAVLPAGRLREFACGAKRADLVVVTKCPSQVSSQEKSHFAKRLKVSADNLFFSTFDYAPLVPVFDDSPPVNEVQGELLLVTGIANPLPLESYLRQLGYQVSQLSFPDHHSFSDKDIAQIQQRYEALSSTQKCLVTTEKDAMRFRQIKGLNNTLKSKMFYVPIVVRLLEDESHFTSKLRPYVTKN